MTKILMISANLATPGSLKIKIFKNIGYVVMIVDYDIINSILSRDSNYIVDVVMWLKIGNSSVSITEVIITLIW